MPNFSLKATAIGSPSFSAPGWERLMGYYALLLFITGVILLVEEWLLRAQVPVSALFGEWRSDSVPSGFGFYVKDQIVYTALVVILNAIIQNVNCGKTAPEIRSGLLRSFSALRRVRTAEALASAGGQ